MRVIEHYYGPRRDRPLEGACYSVLEARMVFPGCEETECFIHVEVDGRHLRTQQFGGPHVPMQHLVRQARGEIIDRLERELFGA
jgi:hypothetical protein